MKFVRNWPFCSQAFECICLKKRVCEKAKATASREHSGSFQSDIDGDGTCQCFCPFEWVVFSIEKKGPCFSFCFSIAPWNWNTIFVLLLKTHLPLEKKKGKFSRFFLVPFSTSKTQKQQFTCYLGKQCFFRSVAVFFGSLTFLLGGKILPSLRCCSIVKLGIAILQCVIFHTDYYYARD